MGTKVTGSAFGDFKAYFEYETSSTNTTYSIKVINAGMYQSCTWAEYPWKTTVTATSYDSRSGTDATARTEKGYHSILEEDKTYSYTRKTSAYTVTIKATTKKNISGGSSGSVSKSFTIPALASYKVTYNNNGGSGAPSAQTKYYGTTLTLSSTKPTRSGYEFAGWGTTTTDTTVAYSAGGSYTSNAAITLYAIWKKTITITYNPNGGSGNLSYQSTTVYNATTSYTFTLSSTKPTRSGYTFVGWGTSSSATSGKAAGESVTLSSSTTYYAIWKKTITLTYNANGGSGAPASTSATIYNATTSNTFTLSSTKPTRTNYEFVGWSTSSTATSGISFGTIILSSNTTLYAVWKLNYVRPTLQITAKRVSPKLSTPVIHLTTNSQDTHNTIAATNLVVDDDEGIYGVVKIGWTAGIAGGVTQSSTIKVECAISKSDNWSTVYQTTSTAASGTTTTNAFLLLDENGESTLSQETQYDIRVTISDSSGSNSATTFISKAEFIIDINETGTGIAFGSGCSRAGISSSWPIYLDKGKYIHGKLADGEDYRLVGTSGSTDSDIHFCYTSYEKSIGTIYYSGNKVNIRSRETININNSISLPNASHIYIKNSSGADRRVIFSNDSNQISFGYDSYAQGEGSTYFDGNRVTIRSKGDITLNAVGDITLDPGGLDVLVDGNIGIPNAQYYACKRSDGIYRNLLCLSTNNNVLVGYGPYTYGDTESYTCVYGNSELYNYSQGPIALSAERATTSRTVVLTGDSSHGYFRPTTDGNICLGTGSYSWYQVCTDRLYVYSARITCQPTYDNTVSYATNTYVGTSGIFSRTTNTSSRTIKHDIKDLSNEDLKAENLYDLDVVQFKYDDGIITDEEDARYGKDLVGFIIENMNEIYPIAVDKPSDDVKEWSWNAQYLIPPMLKLIQDLRKEVDELKGVNNEG